ncbi:MAG TPA: rod shape-determining protein RodA [Tissierellaceae bacterium]|nr:rod shape-determining protein RodA [Tissierellaceae bacterium]
MLNFKKKSFKRFDLVIFITVLALSIYGLIIIKSATLNRNPTRYLKQQGISIIIGIIIIFLLTMMDYRILGKLYMPIYIVSNIMLIIVLLIGVGGAGAEEFGARWIEIGGFRFQPSEFVKIGIIISLAKFIDKNKSRINQPFTLLKILAFAGLPILLIAAQPDAGTALVFVFFTAMMLFVAGIEWKYIGYALGAGLISLPVIWMNLKSHQKNRIFDFLNPERDPTGTGYQAIEAKIAIGSGKIFGRGLYQGVQTQYNFLPEKHTDFIFAVLMEELGFIGGMGLIILYIILLIRFIRVAQNSKDLFGSLVVVGITSMFIFHIFQNIGMTIGLMPITGIPLPFLSYGGTFMLVNMISVGLILSIGIHREGLNF